jgi:hypothetical protein
MPEAKDVASLLHELAVEFRKLLKQTKKEKGDLERHGKTE